MLECYRVCVVRWEEPSCRDYQAEQNGGLNSVSSSLAVLTLQLLKLLFDSSFTWVTVDVCLFRVGLDLLTQGCYVLYWIASYCQVIRANITSFLYEFRLSIKLFFNRSVSNVNIELAAGSLIRALFVLCIIWPWCRRSVLSCHWAHFSVRFIDERTFPDPLTSLFPT